MDGGRTPAGETPAAAGEPGAAAAAFGAATGETPAAAGEPGAAAAAFGAGAPGIRDAGAATAAVSGPEGGAPTPDSAPPSRGFFVRRVDAASEFEIFLVSAVATLLLVRAILALSGWPQLGGGKIHFAHMLWGGLGMLIAIVLLIALEGRLWKQLGALSAGIGFGLFIDELGKFITSNNDYFFRPTIAIIYLIFVGLFFLFRWLGSVRHLSQQTALVNAFDYAKEAVLRTMDLDELVEALYLLSRADQSDPMVVSLRAMLRDTTTLVSPMPTPLQKTKAWLARLYGRLLVTRWFKVVMVGWFLVLSLSGLVVALFGHTAASQVTFAEAGVSLSSLVSGALVVIGVLRFRRSHLAAYRWFERAALVSIFVGEFFAFYKDQLGAIGELVLLLLTYLTIRYMIGTEQKKQAGKTAT